MVPINHSFLGKSFGLGCLFFSGNNSFGNWMTNVLSLITILSDGRPISEICNEYGIHQNQYYTWRDKFLSEAHRAFESDREGGEVNRLRKKNQELKQIIGSLTVELKKTEDEFI